MVSLCDAKVNKLHKHKSDLKNMNTPVSSSATSGFPKRCFCHAAVRIGHEHHQYSSGRLLPSMGPPKSGHHEEYLRKWPSFVRCAAVSPGSDLVKEVSETGSWPGDITAGLTA